MSSAGTWRPLVLGAVVLLQASSSAVSASRAAGGDPSCPSTTAIDKTLVRAGNDYSCVQQDSGLVGCVAACCADDQCLAFSWNAPWGLPDPYMGGCVYGKDCCCLKNVVPPLEPSKWSFNITSGVKAPPAPPRCSSVADCSLNGVCDVGTGNCTCDAGWRGPLCAVLDLVPAASLAGAYQHSVTDAAAAHPDNTSSGGGLPLKGPDGKYHLFAAQFVNNCTLAGWNPASVVVRAVADAVEGPYTYAETVLGTFHHNPTVRLLSPAQSGTGKPLYVMYMIGNDREPPAADCSDRAGDPHHLEGYITMAWSESVLGPWNRSLSTLLTNGNIDRWDAMVTNPAPLFPFPDNQTTCVPGAALARFFFRFFFACLCSCRVRVPGRVAMHCCCCLYRAKNRRNVPWGETHYYQSSSAR